ncbi:hypothetical protein K3495_g6898 [Podosphaera aphanis]|nr:hypothetical protein K3495_g6898 [Podosphaera aphanis]
MHEALSAAVGLHLWPSKPHATTIQIQRLPQQRGLPAFLNPTSASRALSSYLAVAHRQSLSPDAALQLSATGAGSGTTLASALPTPNDASAAPPTPPKISIVTIARPLVLGTPAPIAVPTIMAHILQMTVPAN